MFKIFLLKYYFLFVCYLFIYSIVCVDYANALHIFNNDNSSVPIDSEYIEADHMVNATVGKSATLTCTVHNVKNYKIAWYHSGTILTLDTNRIKEDQRYSIENQKQNEWKLIINQIDLNDEGHYTCRLSNGLKKTIFLRVGVAPKFTTNDSSHHVFVNANEYDNLTLSCEADGNPTPSIYWYNKHNTLISTGVYLHIKNLTRHNHLEYECVARNTIAPDASRHFKINVYFKPIVNLMYHIQEQKQSSQPSNKQETDHNNNIDDSLSSSSSSSAVAATIKQNSLVNNLEFVCETSGNPIYSISWMKNGIKLKETSNNVNLNSISTSNDIESMKSISISTTQINLHKYLAKLQIKNADFSDNGVYECVVSGLRGDISKSVIVKDIIVPVYVLVKSTTKITVLNLKEFPINKNTSRKQDDDIDDDDDRKNSNDNRIEVNINEQYKNEPDSLSFGKHTENLIESNSFIASKDAKTNSSEKFINNEFLTHEKEIHTNRSHNTNSSNLLFVCLILVVSAIITR